MDQVGQVEQGKDQGKDQDKGSGIYKGYRGQSGINHYMVEEGMAEDDMVDDRVSHT